MTDQPIQYTKEVEEYGESTHSSLLYMTLESLGYHSYLLCIMGHPTWSLNLIVPYLTVLMIHAEKLSAFLLY